MDTIVLIDSDVRVLEHHRMLLTAAGYKVVTFSCFEGAKNHIQTHGLSLLIVSWQLMQPQLIALLNYLRQSESLRHRPILALSKGPCIEIQEELIFIAKSKVLKTPLSSSYFLKMVDMMLKDQLNYAFVPLDIEFRPSGFTNSKITNL